MNRTLVRLVVDLADGLIVRPLGQTLEALGRLLVALSRWGRP